MAGKIVSSSGLYLYARSFFIHGSPSPYQIAIQEKKDAIIQKYLSQTMPQLFRARAEASFGNNADIEAIDNFFIGNNTNAGFVQNLQQELDKHYTDSFRNASSLFVGAINNVLSSSMSLSAKENKIIQSSELSQQLEQMIQAQNDIMDNLANLSSMYEQYLFDRCMAGKYQMPRKLKNGLYSKGNFKNAGVLEAISLYNEIQQQIQLFQMAQVTKDLSQSFVVFRQTADAFHNRYAELLTEICAYNLQKNTRQLLIDIKDTAKQQYITGQGDLSVQITSHFSQDFQDMVSKTLPLPDLRGTATNDVSIYASDQHVRGVFGITVKDYSDKTLQKVNGFTTISSSVGNIYNAAQLATQYGLPAGMADPMWITNLGGAMNLPYSNDRMVYGKYWMNYIQLVGSLMVLDGLMGRMKNLSVSSNANNLIFISNGQAMYLGDLIKQMLTLDTIKSFTINMFNQNNLHALYSSRTKASYAHARNFYSGGSAEQGIAVIENILKKTYVKISIDLNNILSQL